MGGYFTRLERDGHRYSDDKDMWMVGRQIWMFSHLYNQHEANPQWLKIARLGAKFMSQYGFKPDGSMYFRLGRDGTPRAQVLSKYTQVFAGIGLAEYSKAAQDQGCWLKAMSIYEQMMPKLDKPEDTPLLGYPLEASFSLHAKQMCKMAVAFVYHAISGEDRFRRDLKDAANDIIARHWKPDLNALLENVAEDGSAMLNLPEGRMFHPGHAIESSWMLMEVAALENDADMFDTAVSIATAAMEQGWDDQMGGLRYLINIDHSPVHNIEADCKLWWPHSEALYALLLAWVRTGRADLGRWYQRVHDYSFGHFPDRDGGEWYGYLNCDGSPIWTAKANGWKGFFHLPRALFRCYQLLDKLTKSPISSSTAAKSQDRNRI